MAYENRKYVIIDASEVSSVDFSQVIQTSADTLRYSLDNLEGEGENFLHSKTFVKFEGDTPSFLEGKTQYSHSEIRNILSGSDWASDELID
mgnify:CR=1 FL=1